MALGAQIHGRIVQQRLHFGEVGFVTLLTVLLGRRMGSLFIELLLNRLVAGYAKVCPLGQEQLCQFRLVGVMTFRTITGLQGSMYTAGGFQPLFDIRMTFKTGDVLLLEKHSAYIAAVGVVAREAVTFGEWGMVRPSNFLFHHIRMTRFAQLGN